MADEQERQPLPFRVLPWLAGIWARLQQARFADRLPHALLLCGAEGLGKHELALALANSLLCRTPADDGTPCGGCQGCALFSAGTHPDLRRIVPEEPGKAIRIDQIRNFTGQAGLAAQAGGYKVTLVAPADAMNIAAANSLLKTLEEPVPWTLMLLITAQPGRLPATIRSRCQRIDLPRPAPEPAIAWLREASPGQGDYPLLLALAAGAPLRAQQYAERGLLEARGEALEEFCTVLERRTDPLQVAARWSGQDALQLLGWISGWVVDMLRLSGAWEPVVLINPDQRERLRRLAQGYDVRGLLDVLDRVYDAIRNLGGSLNTQMVFEDLLLGALQRRR